MVEYSPKQNVKVLQWSQYIHKEIKENRNKSNILKLFFLNYYFSFIIVLDNRLKKKVILTK